MSLADAAEIGEGTVVQCDVCVVGAGAAGLTLARQLNNSGREVIVLEAGGYTRDLAVEADTFALNHTGTAHRSDIESRGRLFGGSTSLWFGRLARPDAIDFADRSWVPDSGWPIERHELDAWFDVACDLLAVENAHLLDIEKWPSTATTDIFSPDAGLAVQPFLWAGSPDLGASSQEVLRRSRTVKVLTNATVREFHRLENARVDSAEVVGPAGTFRVNARVFVLAAGGFENPRLLLASRASQPAGLGNQNDNVGRYYLDHPRGEGLASLDMRTLTEEQIVALTFLDEKVQAPFGEVQLRVVFSEERQRSEGLLNHSLHGYIRTELHDLPGFEAAKRLLNRASSASPPEPTSPAADLGGLARSVPGLARLALRQLRGDSPAPTEFVVVDQLEQTPVRSNRVTLQPHAVDRFGLPLLDVNWVVDGETTASLVRMHELFDDRLRTMGIDTFVSQVLEQHGATPDYLDMKHPSGTTRMSAAPATGVVDPNCRVHGLDNLFIAGSSVFPTAGHFNPTLTIMALAARLASYIESSLA